MPTTRFDVVGIGLCVYDLAMEVAEYPQADTKVDAVSNWHGGGGPVPNTLAALSVWGVYCAFAGTVGDDHWGRALQDDFRRRGVDTTYMRLDPERNTPIASIWVERGTGHRTAVLGAEHFSEPGALPAGLIENARVLHVDARDPAACIQAARRGLPSGIAVSLDVGSPRAQALEVLPHVNHLVVAERFAAFAAEADPARALRRLKQPDYEAVVITRGLAGSVGLDRSGDEVSCGVYPVTAVDTTGAGDVYHAGYLFGLLQGWSLSRRMQFASAAAALSCTALGARGCLPARDDVEALMRETRPVQY